MGCIILIRRCCWVLLGVVKVDVKEGLEAIIVEARKGKDAIT